jgi:excisionase family DNA binding protein
MERSTNDTNGVKALRAPAARLIDKQPEQRLISPKEASRLLAVSQSLMYRMADDGRLKKINVGRAVRFRYSDIRAILES